MKIDLQVENQMLTHPDFLDVLHRACWQLSQPQFVTSVCLHEAAHSIYFKPIIDEMNATAPGCDYAMEFHGPTIYYNTEKQAYAFDPAAIKTPFRDLVYTQNNLEQLAMGCVAGGVFLRLLEGVPDAEAGDYKDSKMFHTYFLMARERDVTPREREEDMLPVAKNAVQKHLENKVFEEFVRTKADEIRAKYF
jgi:hypothetical protein